MHWAWAAQSIPWCCNAVVKELANSLRSTHTAEVSKVEQLLVSNNNGFNTFPFFFSTAARLKMGNYADSERWNSQGKKFKNKTIWCNSFCHWTSSTNFCCFIGPFFWKVVQQAACTFWGRLAFLTPPNLFWSDKVFVGGYKQRAIYTFPERTRVLKIIYRAWLLPVGVCDEKWCFAKNGCNVESLNLEPTITHSNENVWGHFGTLVFFFRIQNEKKEHQQKAPNIYGTVIFFLLFENADISCITVNKEQDRHVAVVSAASADWTPFCPASLLIIAWVKNK